MDQSFKKVICGGEPLQYCKNIYGEKLSESYKRLSRVERPFGNTKTSMEESFQTIMESI